MLQNSKKNVENVRQRSNSTSRFRRGQRFVTANTKKIFFIQKICHKVGGSRNAKISVTYYSNAAFSKFVDDFQPLDSIGASL